MNRLAVGRALAASLVLGTSGSAHAFGGLWSPAGARVEPSAQRVLFVDPPGDAITAVIELAYKGPAAKFAWLVPLPAKPTVAVSSGEVFRRLDAATAPQYWLEVAVDGECMQSEPLPSSEDGGTYVDPSEPDTSGGPVLGFDRGTVGPYDYVTLAVDAAAPDRAKVARDWLANEGYEVGDVDAQALARALASASHLLAFKLTNGRDSGAIRPVTLTYESRQPSVPLQLTALAARPGTPIKVWVLGPSHAVSENYKALVLNDARLDWLSGRAFASGTLPAGGSGPFGPPVDLPRGYDALIASAVREAGGRGFVTELAGPASQFRDKVWSAPDGEAYAQLEGEEFEDGIAAVRSAQMHYASWDGWNEAVEAALTLPSGVTREQFSADPERYRGMAKVDTEKFLALLDERVVRPVIDAAALLEQGPYLTRLSTVMDPEHMTEDPRFAYNEELAQIGNVHVAQQFVRCERSFASWSAAPFHIALPQGGVVRGEGSAAWPNALASLPANLKVVQLSTSGAGTVERDNTDLIRAQLFGDGGVPPFVSVYRAPQHGLSIGGAHDVRPLPQPFMPAPTGPSAPSSPGAPVDAGATDRRADDGCALAAPGRPADGASSFALSLLALTLGRRRGFSRRSRRS